MCVCYCLYIVFGNGINLLYCCVLIIESRGSVRWYSTTRRGHCEIAGPNCPQYAREFASCWYIGLVGSCTIIPTTGCPCWFSKAGSRNCGGRHYRLRPSDCDSVANLGRPYQNCIRSSIFSGRKDNCLLFSQGGQCSVLAA